ncbi:DUF3311 domain-containing protein [Metabacillus arenae]|uniref:DUF3311 domain-containing protein n=1 Tax=Metabacillus arenae TaxID=2771434 RepID=A0A926NRB9_9BACI|nr:DUF3311 domain-containing protein [Metabacillus arenae]MBD1382491.1 DUF3311 domain-containing protein [Metabacillus arenae]
MSNRKFNTLFIVIVLVPFLMLVFPFFEIGNRATPIIMGLPFSFFWVILWIVITFAALLALYYLDPEKEEEGDV